MRLPKHPFPVQTVFRRCLLANFAVDPELLDQLLPRHVEPDTYDGHAYVSVVIGQMDKMRPVLVPRLLGITYNQIVYRAAVRCGDETGVHFLRSDADSRIMAMLGNAMSFFRFHHAQIELVETEGQFHVEVHAQSPGSIHASYDVERASRVPPSTSAFADMGSAQAWLVERYTAFDFTPGRSKIDIVRIDRGDWDVRVLPDLGSEYEFMTTGPLASTGTRLDSVFAVADIPYRWHRLETAAIPSS